MNVRIIYMHILFLSEYWPMRLLSVLFDRITDIVLGNKSPATNIPSHMLIEMDNGRLCRCGLVTSS